MLTPQAVAEQRFGKSFMGGYDMAAVDDFLEILTNDYTLLYKENALLKNKVRVLVDKLEEYRSVDESMRKTWREAQKNAEEMMAQARKDADALFADAQNQSEAQREEAKRQQEIEEHRLNTARQQTVTFVNGLREIYQRQIEQLSIIPSIDLPPQTISQTMEASANQAAFEIEQSVMAQIQGDYGDKTAETREFTPVSESDEGSGGAMPVNASSEPSSEVNVIHTKEGGFYGPDGNELDDDVIKLLWEPEQDTVIPPPRQDGFPDLESQFGSGVDIVKKK